MLKILDKAPLKPINTERRDVSAYCINVEEEPDGKPWYHDVTIIY